MPQDLQINIQYDVTEGLERIYGTFRLLPKILRERDAPKDEIQRNSFFLQIFAEPLIQCLENLVRKRGFFWLIVLISCL